MARGKNINLYLMDGDVNGRVKCTLANWTGLAFKIPRTKLATCKDRDELKQAGVYFLFGKDDDISEQSVVYIGQACIRKNGEGLYNRLQEHDKNPEKDYWTEAIAITTSNNSLGPTEISYLEHRFCQLANDANRYTIKNGNDPNPGNPSEEKISELEDFIDYSKVVVGTLGHKVFVPLVDKDGASNIGTGNVELICTRSGVKAYGVQTSDGFVVKKDSSIQLVPTKTCPDSVKKRREQYKRFINENGVITKDLLFNSPSGASSFVCAANTNGNDEWKNSNGVKLKDL